MGCEGAGVRKSEDNEFLMTLCGAWSHRPSAACANSLAPETTSSNHSRPVAVTRLSAKALHQQVTELNFKHELMLLRNR